MKALGALAESRKARYNKATTGILDAPRLHNNPYARGQIVTRDETRIKKSVSICVPITRLGIGAGPDKT